MDENEATSNLNEDEDYFSKLSFFSFCEACEKIMSKRDKKKKFDILRAFLSYHKNKSTDGHLFTIMRLFLPQLERERGPYGVKEHNLARTYIRILCLPKDSQDAQRLLNYRSPSTSRSSDVVGDFAEVAYWILRGKCGESSKITLGELNHNLDLISEKHASHDPRAVDDILTTLFRKMSADEQKWFIRIILKDMHFGLSTKQILFIYHPDSSEVYDLSNSLLKVCTMLKTPSIRLHELEINVFEPFRPMLSERCDVSKINFTEPLILETKYDGERFQLHYSEGKFKYFSRNGYEYTDNYGQDESGYFTSLIKTQFSPTLTSAILDGEMMAWDTKRKLLMTKDTLSLNDIYKEKTRGNAAANIDVKQLKVGNIVQPCFFAFDILYYNGEILTNKPITERKAILEKAFEEKEGTIMKASYSTVSSHDDILIAINAAIDKCEEGIILKKPDSVYKPNSRSAGWYKIKPEYTEGALVDLDLLIMGGYYGQGKNKGKVSHFLMGLAVPKSEEQPTQFESLCRVGSGYSFSELTDLTYKLAPFWQKLRSDNIPESHLLLREKPDLWIPPEKSCILQIKATEVVDSAVYYCGSTLKFVRVQNIREDKPWHDCLTTSEFQQIKQAYQGKLTSGNILNTSANIPQRKKKNEIESLLDQKKHCGRVESMSNILQSKEFCVISAFGKTSRETIEKMILENGGKTRSTPSSNTYCLIAGDVNVRVKNFCKSGKHIVAHFSWLQDCIEKQELISWTPLSLAGTTLMGKAKLSHKYDKYGDSYLEPVSEHNLTTIINKMKINATFDMTNMIDMDLLLYDGTAPHSIFRGINAYFVTTRTDPDTHNSSQDRKVELSKTIFQFCGGLCVQRVNEFTSFIIIDGLCDDYDNFEIDLNVWDYQYCTFKFISTSWIMDSFHKNQRLPVLNYIIDLG